VHFDASSLANKSELKLLDGRIRRTPKKTIRTAKNSRIVFGALCIATHNRVYKSSSASHLIVRAASLDGVATALTRASIGAGHPRQSEHVDAGNAGID
jgi:hypothetical protein